MAIGYGRLAPVKRAGCALRSSGAAARSAHHSGTRISHGACGRSAYLSGERHIGIDGIVTDYRNKFGVEHSELVLPGGGTCDREQFWNAVDRHKTKTPTADVAYDFIVAMPHEFSAEERRKATRGLALAITDRYGVAVDYGLHLPETHKGSDERNYHAHMLISARQATPSGELGKVQRDLNIFVCQRIDPSRGRTERKPTAGKEIRVMWERIANEALERGGHAERIDMRSWKERGVDRKSKHLGKVKIDQLRKEASQDSLQKITEIMKERIEESTRRIDEIRKQQNFNIDKSVDSRIGDIEEWQQDVLAAFMRAWQSEDRAQKLRKRLTAISRNQRIKREPTQKESEELKRLIRIRKRAELTLHRALD